MRQLIHVVGRLIGLLVGILPCLLLLVIDRGVFCVDKDLAAAVLRYEEKLLVQSCLKRVVSLRS